VGLVWQGNPTYRADDQRSIPLARLLPLAKMEGVDLYSLQKHHGREQLLAFERGATPVPTDLGGTLDDDGAAFLDTAAVLRALDLLVTSDTAIAHLAGALGVETWLLLAHRPDWRWGTAGDRTPFYPRTRLFRQERRGDWTELVERVCCALAARRDAAGVRVDHSPAARRAGGHEGWGP
jgi:hypothetical protein